MNAFTAKEYTCFYARVLDTDLPLAVDVVCDMVTSSLITAGRRRRRARRDPRRDRHARRRPGRLVHDAVRPGALRRHPARPPGPRHRRVDRGARPRRRSPATTGATTARRTWSSPPPATSTTPRVVRLVRKAFASRGPGATATPRPPAPRPGAPARRRRRRRARHPPPDRAGQPRARRARPEPRRRPALRPRRAQRRPRRRHVVAGCSRRSARSAAWPTRSTRYHAQYADTGLFGVYAGCVPAQGRRGPRDLPRTSSSRSPTTASPPRSSSAARASCAGRWCSASRTPARG